MDGNTLTLLAAWAAVAVTLFVVWLQNRASKRLTCLQLFVQLAAQYDSGDMQRTRANLAAKLLADPNTHDISDSLLVFYENIAILHRRGLLDSELMINTFSIDVRSYWRALENHVLWARNSVGDAYGNTGFYTEFQQLNDYFVEQAKSQKPHSQESEVSSVKGLSDAAIQDFLLSETLRGDTQMLGAQALMPLNPSGESNELRISKFGLRT